jgi:UDP-N-acetylmuramoyl-tripeptide--D-alanyl-D-alanine ligase
MTTKELHTLFLDCSGGVQTDTRRIVSDCFFIAIKGDNFNANQFAANALENGAKYALIDEKEFYVDDSTILVENCLIALQELARFHRRFLKTPIIALTGSNGKTTTKELLSVVLSLKFKTLATTGNLNNHIGVPLTLLRLKQEHEMAIVEMGANHQKEIQFLCELAEPDYGYITNFGKAHLEGFGGVEGVIKGKSEMYDYLIANHKNIFINADYSKQLEKASGGNLITFGVANKNANFLFNPPIANPFVELLHNSIVFTSQLTGIYNSTNIMVSIVIARYFGVELASIQNAIQSFYPENNRSQLLNIGTNQILLDAYNANPSSMFPAIEHFVSHYKHNTVLILGDMFELGLESNKEHQTIVDLVSHKELVTAYFVGNYFNECKVLRENFLFFQDFESLASYLSSFKIVNSSILVKGSRGMALERVLNYIK